MHLFESLEKSFGVSGTQKKGSTLPSFYPVVAFLSRLLSNKPYLI